MPSRTDISSATDAMIALEMPRVWSMLVSIFGDLAFRPGDRIDGPVLTILTDGMEIKPEAVRVALHRLRNDGWIDSVKSGRTAQHALTPNALKQRNDAAPLIYTPTREMPQGWQMATIPQADAALRTRMTGLGFVPITPRVLLAHDAIHAPREALLSTGSHAPDWISRELLPEELAVQFDTLLTALQRVRLSVHHARAPIEIALLRCLIVHHWRRLVLRYPYLPPALTGADWPAHQCRDLVCELLDALPRPKLDSLASADRRTAR